MKGAWKAFPEVPRKIRSTHYLSSSQMKREAFLAQTDTLVHGASMLPMKHKSAPKEKCPKCLSLRGPLGDTPPIRNKTLMGPCKAPEGTNTKVTLAKGHFCAYPMLSQPAFRRRFLCTKPKDNQFRKM